MHHACMLAKCILGCLLWDNPTSLVGLKQEEESKGPQVCHAIFISRLLGCGLCDCTVESLEIIIILDVLGEITEILV